MTKRTHEPSGASLFAARVAEPLAARLRPRTLDEYIGQSQIKKHLRIAIESARIRKETLEHLLFYGPPGLGKTTIANLIAMDIGKGFKSTRALLFNEFCPLI